MKTLQLVPLQCPQCARPLAAGEGEHLLATCGDCGTCCEVVKGVPLPRTRTVFRPRAGAPNEFVPFWRIDARVEIFQRETAGVGQFLKDFFNLGRGDRKDQHRFFVPAFEVNMEAFKALGLQMLKLGEDRLVAWDDAPDLPIRPATMSLDEASQTLEFLILTIEAQKSDMMVNLCFQVDVLDSGLALVPASTAGTRMDLLL